MKVDGCLIYWSYINIEHLRMVEVSKDNVDLNIIRQHFYFSVK